MSELTAVRSLLIVFLSVPTGCAADAASPQAASPPPRSAAASTPTTALPAAPPALRDLVAETFAAALHPAPGQTAFPGLVVGILHCAERYVIEFGTLDAAEAGVDVTAGATEHLLFPVASLTKPVTALLLAKLAARGDIDLDAAAVPCELHPNLFPDGRAITWRQLATHTSGLPVLPDDLAANLNDAALSAYSADEFEAWLAQARLGRAPGAGFEYSTTGYALLGARLAERTGRPFTQLLRDEVLAPLGMRDARFTLGAEDLPRFAAGHRSDGTPVPSPPAATPSQPPRDSIFAPSGGLITSASDLLALLQANMHPDETWRTPVELLLRPHEDLPSFPPSVMALGWQYLTPAGFYWHAGHGSGHHGFMAFHPAGEVGVVVLATSAASPADTRLAQASFALLGGLLAADAAGAQH